MENNSQNEVHIIENTDASDTYATTTNDNDKQIIVILTMPIVLTSQDCANLIEADNNKNTIQWQQQKQQQQSSLHTTEKTPPTLQLHETTHQAAHTEIEIYTTNTHRERKVTTHKTQELPVTANNTKIVQPKKNNQQYRTYSTREVIVKDTYTESRTHGLIIEEPKTYIVNKAKYNPNDTVWKNE